MKRMSVTTAFMIAILVTLWFFGVTVFNFGPQALLGTGSFLGNILSAWTNLW